MYKMYAMISTKLKFLTPKKINSSYNNFERLLCSFERLDFDVIIVGGGIIGCATARELSIQYPKLKIALVEKESKLGLHQTGNNSGVIHCGIYYKPGSLKAKLCAQGLRLCYEYCDEKKIPYKKIGKLIVATTPEEVVNLKVLEDRGKKNKVPELQVLKNQGEIQEIEPYCQGLEALWSPHTGIVNFHQVCLSYADDFKKNGGAIFLDFEVNKFEESGDKQFPVRISSIGGNHLNTKFVFTCGGLYSDKLATKSNCSREPMIIPFRGEYLKLHSSKNYLVKGNIYPVPDPRFPFLGVHFTPKLDGSVLLGPNAILGFCREAYSWTDFKANEFFEIMKYPGLRKMVLKYFKPAMNEVMKSVITSKQVEQLQRYIPEVTPELIESGQAGVRAQAMMRNGDLVDDFVFSRGEGHTGSRILHCRNAPSPAATSSMAIGRMLVAKMQKDFGLE